MKANNKCIKKNQIMLTVKLNVSSIINSHKQIHTKVRETTRLIDID